MNKKKIKQKTNAELVQLFLQSKDAVFFDEIYLRHITPVFRFIYGKVGNKHVAEDLAAETFLTLIEVLHKFNYTSKLRTYIIGIALNKVRQYWQQLGEEKKVEYLQEYGYATAEEDVYDVSGIVTHLDILMNELSEKYATVLRERFLRGSSTKYVADMLNTTPGNIRVIQKRALEKALKIAQDKGLTVEHIADISE